MVQFLVLKTRGVGGSNATHMGGRNWVAIKLNNKKMKIEIY